MGLAFVACQDPFEAVTHFAAAEAPLPFPFLVDGSRATARAYGVYAFYSGGRFRVARPATFLIDRAKTVRFSHVGRSPQDGLPLDPILAALPSLMLLENRP